MSHKSTRLTDNVAEQSLVSFIVITRNRWPDLQRCLASLIRQDYQPAEIIVVNNGSTDDTSARVTEAFPAVRLLNLDANQGVTGGRNRGIEAARGDICIFLDDDAVLVDPAAARLTLDFFRADPALGALAYRIVSPETGREDYRAIPRRDKQSLEQDYPCAYFCGAGFALRREALQEIGLFWEQLFYCGEELDLSYRLLSHGYRLLHTAAVRVDHFETPRARPGSRQVYYYGRNRGWVAIRHLPWFNVVTTVLAWWGYLLPQAVRGGLFGTYVRAIRDFFRGIPAVLRIRRPLPRALRRQIRHHAGRTWY